jgi:hypothetical protein
MKEKVIRGTAAQANASERNGWVMGPFFSRGSLSCDPTHETKLWRYDTNPEYGLKGFRGTEFIVVYGGRLRLMVLLDDGSKEEYVLEGASHDYIILPPHRKNVVAEICPAFGVTVRWHSAVD